MDLQTEWEIGVDLRRSSWLMHAAQVKFKGARLADALRAYAKYNPSQPRVPRGNPDGGQWTDAGGGSSRIVGGTSSDTLTGGDEDDNTFDPSTIPEDEPGSAQIRNIILKQLAQHVVTMLAEDALTGGAALALNALEIASWVHDFAPFVISYADPPKSLEKLQQSVFTPETGYNIHHIVEQGPARDEKFPDDLIDGRDNLVRIPTFKHWRITSWYATKNPEFNGMSPRDYLRGKDWAERTRIGLRALVDQGVLKP